MYGITCIIINVVINTKYCKTHQGDYIMNRRENVSEQYGNNIRIDLDSPTLWLNEGSGQIRIQIKGIDKPLFIPKEKNRKTKETYEIYEVLKEFILASK